MKQACILSVLCNRGTKINHSGTNARPRRFWLPAFVISIQRRKVYRVIFPNRRQYSVESGQMDVSELPPRLWYSEYVTISNTNLTDTVQIHRVHRPYRI